MAHERTAYDAKFETILHTAAAIFAQKGYHQASIRDIARATRVSLSGLYYYFQSKEELLFLIQDHALGTLLADLDARLQGEADPQRRILHFMENHLRYFVDNMAEMKVLSHEAASLTGEYHTQVNAKKRRLSEIAARLVHDLRPAEPPELRVSTFALFGMMNWIYTWYNPERDVPVDRLVALMGTIFLDGYLRAPPEPLFPLPVPTPVPGGEAAP